MGYKVGILGATGAVGQEIIRLLGDRRFPVDELRLLASARSAGKTVLFRGEEVTIQQADERSFADLDVAIFSAGASQTKQFAEAAVNAGCVVIDNSSAYRLDDRVPLVIPEINAETVDAHDGIIANPNCSTAIALMGLYPLHRAFGLKGVIAATYQAVSGSGAEAMAELDAQTRAWASGEALEKDVYPHQIAFNLLPHVDGFLDDGSTKEEMKMRNESRKILGLPDLGVTCTCVRVPVFRAHSIAINASFAKPCSVEEAKRAFEGFDATVLVDDPAENRYPMPIEFSEVAPCGVGRIRRDEVLENGLALWVVGDQLWKGAALNAIQIAESLVARDRLGVAPSGG